MEIDNRSIRLGDELKKEIKSGSMVKIAAATFSMFAFQQLKEELETIEELKFIFTNPTFVTDETRVGYREYTIPKKEREQSIFGGRYELKLMNELTQKAIARECAEWIRKKARFKSINIETDEMPNGMRIMILSLWIDSKTLIERNWAMILLCSKRHGISTMLH